MRYRGPGFTHHNRQALDRFAGFAGNIATAAGQTVGFLGRVGSALHMAGHFLGGGSHLVDGGGHLLGLDALALQSGRAFVRQNVGLTGLAAEVFGGILQACQAGLQARFLAQDGHFQTRLRATAVGVHLGNQRVGGGLLGQTQQAFDPALLPAQAQQPQRYRQQGCQGKTPARIEHGANHEAQLADQDKGQPVLQHRQPLIALRHRGFAAVEACVQGFGAADLFGRWLDPHRLVAHYLLILENRRYIGVNPVMVAVFAAVFDDAHPRRTLFQGAPHMLEDC